MVLLVYLLLQAAVQLGQDRRLQNVAQEASSDGRYFDALQQRLALYN